jgi:hypothetical protein
MQIEAGTAIAIISFIGSLIIGFGAWMFRMDRANSHVRVLVQDLHDLKAENYREHEKIWDKFDEHGRRLNRHGEAISGIRSTIGGYRPRPPGSEETDS